MNWTPTWSDLWVWLLAAYFVLPPAYAVIKIYFWRYPVFDQFGNKLEKGDPVAVTFGFGVQDGILLDIGKGRVVFAISFFTGESQILPGVVKRPKPELPT